VAPTLILISPGPGRPADFGVPDLVKTAVRLGLPVFGVCLGLQGIVEAFGGDLGVLDYPMHGKRSMVRHRGVGVFEGLPEEFQVGRYHSCTRAATRFRVSRSDRRNRGWRHHGRAPSRAADRSRAVPPGIDSHHAAHISVGAPPLTNRPGPPHAEPRRDPHRTATEVIAQHASIPAASVFSRG
jgi:hypothetical protein